MSRRKDAESALPRPPVDTSDMTEEKLREIAKRLYPTAEKMSEILARYRPTGSEVADALHAVLKASISETLASVASDYVVEHLSILLPEAVDRVLAGEWEAHVNGRRVKETLEGCVLRVLEQTVQRDIAARYKVEVSVKFVERIRES